MENKLIMNMKNMNPDVVFSIKYHGDYIEKHKSGFIWFRENKKGTNVFILNIGKIVNKVCNTGHLYGTSISTKDDIYPVDKALLRFANQLHIRKLRLELTKRMQTDVGERLIVRYGYLDRSKFESLLSKRKEKIYGLNGFRRCLLLKKSDFTFKRY